MSRSDLVVGNHDGAQQKGNIMSDKVYRHGHFVWRELTSTDLGKARAFYPALFGWTLSDMPMPNGTYTIIKNGEKQIGGMMGTPPGAPPMSYWTSYASVKDIDAVIRETTERGGKVLMGPHTAENVGRFGILADPAGAVVAAITQEHGDGAASMPGVHEFVWESLNTHDAARATPFYEKVLGLTAKTENGMTTLHAADGMVADVGVAPPGMPSHWVTHVAVEKLEHSRGLVEKLGGKVVMPEIQVPGYGRLAIVQDPAGAFFSIFEPAPRA